MKITQNTIQTNLLSRLALLAIFSLFALPSYSSQVKALQQWLATSPDERPRLSKTDFYKAPLSKEDAQQAANMIWGGIVQKTYEQKYAAQWQQRVLQIQDHNMPFFYKFFGEQAAGERSLFISLHGGGGAPARVNDKQYRNQQRLYDKVMNDVGGMYLAMRAPSNEWNMWHRDYIDDFIDVIINMAVIKEGVNRNKVYLLGYSAGGDGLYQLAPRMADRLASAAMMAGHPGDAQPDNLYNLPFAIHMGAKDRAYDRNKHAQTWGKTLDGLAAANPGHYLHQVVIHEGLGHWMKLKDSVALPWMAQYERNPLPEKIIWKQDNRYHEQFYWLALHNFQPRAGKRVVAEYQRALNRVEIQEAYSGTIQIYLNDQMLDLDKEVSIAYQGKVVTEIKPKRTIQHLVESLNRRGDINLAFPVKVEVKLP